MSRPRPVEPAAADARAAAAPVGEARALRRRPSAPRRRPASRRQRRRPAPVAVRGVREDVAEQRVQRRRQVVGGHAPPAAGRPAASASYRPVLVLGQHRPERRPGRRPPRRRRSRGADAPSRRRRACWITRGDRALERRRRRPSDPGRARPGRAAPRRPAAARSAASAAGGTGRRPARAPARSRSWMRPASWFSAPADLAHLGRPGRASTRAVRSPPASRCGDRATARAIGRTSDAGQPVGDHAARAAPAPAPSRPSTSQARVTPRVSSAGRARTSGSTAVPSARPCTGDDDLPAAPAATGEAPAARWARRPPRCGAAGAPSAGAVGQEHGDRAAATALTCSTVERQGRAASAVPTSGTRDCGLVGGRG